MEMKRRQLAALSLAAALLLVPLAASADSHEMGSEPLTWISYAMSQSGKGQALSAHIAQGGAKIYDGLMADGHVLSWGVGMPINHHAGDDWNVMEWVTFRDWAAVDAFMGAFMTMQMAKSPEEMKADAEKWYSLIEAGSHRDEIARHMVMVPSTTVKPAYLSLAYFPVHIAKAGKVKKLWQEYAQPTMTKLQEAGTVGAFGIAVTEIHDGETPHSVAMWEVLPNLGARDAMDAAFDAASKERGEEKEAELMKAFMSMVDMDRHHDRIIFITHLGGQSGGEGGE